MESNKILKRNLYSSLVSSKYKLYKLFRDNNRKVKFMHHEVRDKVRREQFQASTMRNKGQVHTWCMLSDIITGVRNRNIFC